MSNHTVVSAGPPSFLTSFIAFLATRKTIITALSLLILSPVLVRVIRQSHKRHLQASETDTDPPLFRKHSVVRSYHVSQTGFTYPAIRTLYRQHPQVDKLPNKPASLPLLVFIHGLGGSAAQFGPLLTSLINVGPCICIDLPGCGLSHFAPTAAAAYTQKALTELLKVIIESHRDAQNDQHVLLIGHSMGCSLSANVAASADMVEHVAGVVALCPRITAMSEAQAVSLRKLLMIPTSLFDLMRSWDQRGGLSSASVRRFVGPDSDAETRKLQLKFNQQSKTIVLKRMMSGLLTRDATGQLDGLAGPSTWERLDCPILLIGGESDNLNAPSEAQNIERVLREGWSNQQPHPHSQSSAARRERSRYVKTVILPKPASHALIYAPQQCRIVSGLVQSFLADYVDPRLSLGWQLQYLSKEGKWDVKNLGKWQKIIPVSQAVGGVFRAMKTMRELDEDHNPTNFCKQWTKHIHAVVDISHEAPVYDPRKLEEGGIEYQKFPTVSKLPPKAEEVAGFNDLIDRLRQDNDDDSAFQDRLIAVHCHYGFNRTGFFIVCYLVERLGWQLQAAVDEFEAKRPPGIKHQYFVDELSVRYCSGLTRSATL